MALRNLIMTLVPSNLTSFSTNKYPSLPPFSLGSTGSVLPSLAYSSLVQIKRHPYLESLFADLSPRVTLQYKETFLASQYKAAPTLIRLAPWCR